MQPNQNPALIFRAARRAVAGAMSLIAASVVLLAFAPAATAAALPNMVFEQVVGPNCPVSGCILAAGEIGAETAHDFALFVRVNAIQPGALVLLDSKGGNLTQAMKLGLSIRRAHISTRVQRYDRRTSALRPGASCTAECVYAFLGGVQRSIGDEGKLGVQQLSANTNQPALESGEAQRVVGLISTYTSAMGATSELVSAMLGTAPGHARWLSASELNRFVLVTGPH